jgi:hypothetical protein
VLRTVIGVLEVQSVNKILKGSRSTFSYSVVGTVHENSKHVRCRHRNYNFHLRISIIKYLHSNLMFCLLVASVLGLLSLYHNYIINEMQTNNQIVATSIHSRRLSIYLRRAIDDCHCNRNVSCGIQSDQQNSDCEPSSSGSIVSDYGPGDRGSMPGRSKRIVPLSSVSRPALCPTQPPVQWVPGVLSPEVKQGQDVTLTTRPHIVP